MFFHLFRYRCKMFLHDRANLFWLLVFPILLGTFFSIAFGGIAKQGEAFHIISVAAVREKENSYFQELLTELSQKGDNQLLRITYTDMEDANSLLEKEKVSGIYKIGDETELILKDTGIPQTILSSILDDYIQIQSLIGNVAKENPANVQKAVERLAKTAVTNTELSASNGTMDPVMQNFYALLAMAALYASFCGLSNAKILQANLSSKAARRVAAPCGKFYMLMADFAAGVTIHFGITLIVIAYMKFALSVDFGNKLLPVLLAALAGTAMGVSLGFFIGCIGRAGTEIKEGLVVVGTMILSLFSGLYYPGIKNMVDQAVPLLNKINPAVALSDAYYCLNIYDTYDRYLLNIAILLVFTILFYAGGYLMSRRKAYASL